MDPPGEMIPRGLIPACYKFPRITIVGILSDVKHFGLNQQVKPEVFTPHLQGRVRETERAMFLTVRTTSNPLNLVATVHSQVLSMDKEQPIANVTTMEQLLSDSVSRARFTTLL